MSRESEMVAQCCAIAGVPLPRVELTDDLPTPTTWAAVSADCTSIGIRPGMPDIQAFYSVAHEVRHLWQHITGWDLETHQMPGTESAYTYNLQPEEVDAHAWACLICSEIYGVRPRLEDALGGDVWRDIERRINQIKLTERTV